MDQWMQHRQLPPELRERVHSYEQYKWLETRGVKEKELIDGLPKDLRRDIKRHLCLKLVKGVLFLFLLPFLFTLSLYPNVNRKEWKLKNGNK
jgi:hypothetical protein